MADVDKDSLRKIARSVRSAQRDKDALSRSITRRLVSMPVYRHARCVLWYVDVRSEVRTRDTLCDELGGDQTLAVPYCEGDALRLFRLESIDELSRGTFGILEPDATVRGDGGRIVRPDAVDLIVVPGLAFDLRGGRLGYGRGFYDRLLADVRAETVLVGLAYECQLFASVPVDDHDVGMDWLVTESRSVRCL